MKNAAIAAGILAVAVMAMTTATSADIFVKGPTVDELKAKNTPGNNWEGPHVPELTSMEEMEAALKVSDDEPIIIFKHSTQCDVCSRASYRMNQWMEKSPNEVPKMYFVKVIEKKPVSQALAKKLKVKHESPQVLLIQDGKSVWDTSHEDITVENIKKGMKRLDTKESK